MIMLTIKKIDSIKAVGRIEKIADANGLYLLVTGGGTKSWRYNYKLAGAQKIKTYGRYRLISLFYAKHLHIKHPLQISKTMGRFVLPVIGKQDVAAVKRCEFVSIVREVQDAGRSGGDNMDRAARRVGQRIGQMFRYKLNALLNARRDWAVEEARISNACFSW